MSKNSVFAALLLGSVFAAGGAMAADPEVYKIGGIFAMTGASPHYGKVMSGGAQLAVDEINAKGGIDGTKLQLVVEDHKSGSAQAAVAGMNRLIDVEGVKAVLPSFSTVTLATMPIGDQKKILMLNGGGVSAQTVGTSPYMFNIRSMASDLAGGIAHRAAEQGAKKLAQIAIKSEFGDATIAATTKAWEGMGLKMVAAEQFQADAANIDTQVAKLRASQPDAIANWPTTPQAGLAVKRLRELGMKQPVYCMEWTAEDSKVAGKHADGVEVVTDYFAATDENPWSKRFAEAYKAKFGDMPDFYAANYYEGVYVIAELIRRSKAKGGDYYTGERLVQALWENPTFDSVYGKTLTFRKNGVAQKPVAVFRLENGEPKFVKFTSAE
ncbi:ABC transporter substrate-binding protein [Azospirillum doebereinerae]|uniref:ABC transporter substrate-binding protein n=1 Tax=Azospirillum doebereinerae TaxID=92933 RepID=UPI001EE5F0C9|nr:ABC transporter substrate-binding protein [Azospirillum doebereinerae]MCG5238806.1 ABC transporter substrate-binding protein [Azospirillum doebereinerae]